MITLNTFFMLYNAKTCMYYKVVAIRNFVLVLRRKTFVILPFVSDRHLKTMSTTQTKILMWLNITRRRRNFN